MNRPSSWTIVALDQRRVYADVLEGVPTRHINQQIIEDELAQARRRHHLEPVLIEPPERRLKPTGPEDEGTPYALPAVVCSARLRSQSPAKDPAADGCELCVVWFQPELALPIDESVRAQIQRLDWAELASDRFT